MQIDELNIALGGTGTEARLVEATGKVSGDNRERQEEILREIKK